MIPKMRAWDKHFKHMHEVRGIEMNNDGRIKSITVSCVMLTERSQKWSTNLDEVVLMPSTGLFDKNGKEIFVGDIVEYVDNLIEGEDYFVQGIINRGEVYLNTLGGIYFTNRESIEMNEFDIEDNRMVDVTIVGNIYESPNSIYIPSPWDNVPLEDFAEMCKEDKQ